MGYTQYRSVKDCLWELHICRDVRWNVSTRVIGRQVILSEPYWATTSYQLEHKLPNKPDGCSLDTFAKVSLERDAALPPL
ncbi:hypothetical protein NIES4073_29730 [Kalymmatonema gypsitolerans NIES-4073]|nr:hypothetical protein NIES4073_29730 [Scytonema sp. NIES-4073]